MCDLILVACFIMTIIWEKSTVWGPYVSSFRVRKTRTMPLEKRTWNEANAATNVFSRSYDEILIVWFNLDPRVLSYPSLAPQGQVGEDPCDWVGSGQMGKYLALGQDYFSVQPSNSVIKYRAMHPCIVDPTMKMPPHPAAHAHKFISRKYPQLARAKVSTVFLYKCWI